MPRCEKEKTLMTSDQPVSIRQGEEINLEALNNYLRKNSSIGTVKDSNNFPVAIQIYLSYSNRSGEFILRRPPAGTAIKSAHDMGRNSMFFHY